MITLILMLLSVANGSSDPNIVKSNLHVHIWGTPEEFILIRETSPREYRYISDVNGVPDLYFHVPQAQVKRTDSQGYLTK